MSVIDEIKDRLDIVDVVSTYVQLKKAGRTYKGLCPFHNEKTPSFVVFPDSQNWHCFGACGTGGDIFSFVMKRENLDFGDALALLAGEGRRRAEAAGRDRRRRRTGGWNGCERSQTDAAVYFHHLLNKSKRARIARDYLSRRGLDARRRGRPGNWVIRWIVGTRCRDRLQGKGYRPEEIEEAGLVIRREEGSSYYDRFRGRLMIPIRDSAGAHHRLRGADSARKTRRTPARST